ncbi:putative endo-1,4-beta-xylanase [Xylogone sp. PMI_703]|nr:putative endo-1,4-beta-xylanase [Xylogone sp. PMI_703]
MAQLNTLAKAKGLKYFGSATDNPELTNSAYVSILTSSEFGQVTPGNSQKWDAIEPSQGVFTYTNGDAVVSLAQNAGQILRCHNLCWYNQLPNWVTSGSWTNATLIAALKNHITNEVTHYKGKCYAWDVVNEPFNDDGTYRTDVFYNVIGPEYIPIAFEAAAAADPDVKLYYNDYNIEYSGAKQTAAVNLVKSLKSRGIKIDGVGLQGHFIVGQTPNQASQTSNLNSFKALGVEVAYTELDIRHTSLPPSTSALAQQATDYFNTVAACVAAGCVGITIWDYTDKYSWIPSTFPGQGDACPWDSNLAKKPQVYNAIASALGGSGSSTTAVTSTTLATSTTRAPTTTTSHAPGATQTHWGQCGGQTYTGPTVCEAGTTCTYSNPYYSQCL